MLLFALLSWKDVIITPIYLLIIILLVVRFSRKAIKDRKLRKLFRWGFYARILATIFFALIHDLYYGGDTGSYFLYGSKFIWESFFENPSITFDLLFNSSNLGAHAEKYVRKMYLDFHGPEGIIMRVAALVGFFTFHTYTLISLIFSIFCYSGLWRTFYIFQKNYPNIRYQLAFAFLFLPSVVFWSSGLLKDPLTLGALGWLFSSAYYLTIEKNSILRNSIFVFISAIIIFNIKVYILLAVLPPIILWVFREQSAKIKNKTLRLLLKPIFLIIGGGLAYLGGSTLTEGDSRYDIEKIGERTQINYYYLSKQMRTASAYDIDPFDGSLESFIKVAPQAINVAIFRPYVWEAANIFMLLSAIEASLFIVLTVKLLWQIGIFKTLKLTSQIPLVTFSIIFSLIFAFAVGSNSGNFGTLVRYKIPLMPFFLAGLLIMHYKSRSLKKVKRNLINA